MQYKLITYGGGGIFSIFMDIILPHIWCLDNVEEFNITVKNNQYNPPENCFDYVFDQPDIQEPVLECMFSRKRGGWRKHGIERGAIEDFNELDRLKQCCRKFKIKKEILDKLYGLPDNCLGVHFRGMDMNKRHPKYGVFTYHHYREMIEQINPQSIFIASDNFEVIGNLHKHFNIPILYFSTFIRDKTTQDDTYDTQMRNANNRRYWQEAFIDMLMLSRCSSLLCRVSNFANAAILFSDGIKVHRL